MKNLLLALATLVLPVVLAVPALAEIGGQYPGPGLCEYPFIAGSGMDFGVYHYHCEGSLEINGSRYTCNAGGAAGEQTSGVGIFIFTFTLSTPVGVVEGGCNWLCPDGQASDWPNPPGAWKNELHARKCVPLPPPPPPPDPENPGAINDHPAVTNPDTGNPLQTDNR